MDGSWHRAESDGSGFQETKDLTTSTTDPLRQPRWMKRLMDLMKNLPIPPKTHMYQQHQTLLSIREQDHPKTQLRDLQTPPLLPRPRTNTRSRENNREQRLQEVTSDKRHIATETGKASEDGSQLR
ncbi:hypothetical protein WMY93_023368 [Mugilogobius chulae]|uniref:Uncharacterized protein n=1 Tax=Mugilogobius chulae TaxID=88201 RepID=A0AAW0NF55_9GOBI